MKSVRWGRTELHICSVGFGSWPLSGPNFAGQRQVGWSGHDDGLGLSALERAHDLGIRHWDTADVYGNGRAEKLFGRALKQLNREDIVLASKVGWDPGEFSHFYHPELMRTQLEASLRRLGVETIDVYYLHHCDFGPDGCYFEPALECMHRFRQEGKIRFIGLSDWDANRIMRWVDRVNPDVVQAYRNVAHDDYVTSGLKAWVAEHDAGVAFFSPLRHGLLLGKYAQPTVFPKGDFRNEVRAFTDPLCLEQLRLNGQALAQHFHQRINPVLSALVGSVLWDEPTACALLGLRNPQQAERAAAIDVELEQVDVRWVQTLYEGLQI
jgi:aryl-alcohol dehydrogenase-like predicted oxidoreductase